jgi:hypothetical protein
MALDDLHEEGTATVLADLARRPQPVAPSSPKFSAWSTLTAAPRGVAGGAAETGGFWADILGAFGQVGGAYPEALGVIPDAKQRRQADEQRTKLLEQGVDYSSEAGDTLRAVARDHYAPDPLTAHAAEQTMYGLSRFMTKAVGYSVAGGPVAGSVFTGADEAMTASDDLRLKGVDLATRTKAGAIAGVSAAAGVALPVAGKTAVQTAALVALGGPASFMAQQAATREVLKAAKYDHLASQYDPLDPVGLTISTLVPAAFGAWAMRGTRGKAAAPPPEQVDAARVALAVQERAVRNVGDDSIAARQAHENATLMAEQQMAAGERVEVSGVAPEPAAPMPDPGLPPETPVRPTMLQEFEQSIVREVRNLEREMKAAEPPARSTSEPTASTQRAAANPTAAEVRAALDQAASGKSVDGETSPLLSNALAGVKEAGEDAGKLAAIRGHAEAMAEAAPNRPPADIMADAIEAMRAGKPVPGADPAVSTPKDAVQAEQMAVAQRIAEVQQAYPELEVMLDGMDKPMRLADLLDAAQREADEMNADAPLYQIAAMCALTNGI